MCYNILKKRVGGCYMKEISLPQFRGQSNPYDTLWYLSIEIGRSLIFQAKRLGMNVKSSVPALMERYNEIYNELCRLSEREKEFLLSDSYFAQCDFYNDENKKIMDLENESASMMTYSSQLVSEAFLKATLGNKEGAEEYQRRCNLAKVGKHYKNNFLSRVLDHIDDANITDDGIQEFLKKFDTKPSADDIQLMIDVNNTSPYRFYTGKEEDE